MDGDLKLSYQFNEYVAEIERYGGDRAIGIAEDQFYVSSKTIIRLIKLNYNLWDYNLAMSLVIQMHLFLSRHLFSKMKDEMSFYRLFFENWLFYSKGIDGKLENAEVSAINKLVSDFESTYQKQKITIKSLIELTEENQKKSWSIRWKAECAEIAGRYRAHDLPDKYHVYSSLIHMTNNRLGIHISDESFIAYLIFRGLEERLLD